ncbi:unnamed protein product [Closterium sp. Yama58-4]|nr:unnamed protein product [Closterium sp. Yama58-4]
MFSLADSNSSKQGSKRDPAAVPAAWAQLQQLPPSDRLHTAVLPKSGSLQGAGAATDGGKKGAAAELAQVDLRALSHAQRERLVERALETLDQDNEAFLTKLKSRLDRVGLSVPSVEVRFEDVNVEAGVYVGTRALPTLLNFTRNSIAAALHSLGVELDARRPYPILHGCSGVLRPGRMTLLLGPPGAGKSTLLQALAGCLDKSLKVSGSVTYNGHALNEFVPGRTAVYVPQNDEHIGEMTVRETLDFSARLQGPGLRKDLVAELERREAEQGIMPDPTMDAIMKVWRCVLGGRYQIQTGWFGPSLSISICPHCRAPLLLTFRATYSLTAPHHVAPLSPLQAMALEGNPTNVITDYVLKILGLDICADTVVGNNMLRGISGGQKKRVTTGISLVGGKQVLLMDEISTGLDSSTTFLITRCLRHLTHLHAATMLVALLQPAPETYELFDDVLLLSEGHVVFHGPREHVLPFFSRLGFECPARKGEADFLQEVTSMKDQGQYWKGGAAGAGGDAGGKGQPYHYVPVTAFEAAFKETQIGKATAAHLSRYALPTSEMFRAVFAREYLLMQRNFILYAAQTIQIILVALVTMTVFFRTTLTVSLQDGNYYLGATFFGVVMMLFNGFTELPLVNFRLPVFYRQRDAFLYPAWAWAVPLELLSMPFSAWASIIWTTFTYYGIGFAPEPGRFFMQMFLYFLIHQVSISLFRLIGALGRNMVVSATFGSFADILLVLMGGFVIAKADISNVWIRAYWFAPLMYGLQGPLIPLSWPSLHFCSFLALPINPLPINPLPINPLPINLLPINPLPINPLPINLLPINPLPINPLPINPLPINPLPINPLPINPLPINPLPINPLPINPLPINPLPINPLPINPLPINPLPINPLPINPLPILSPLTADISNVWIWASWISPLMYAQNALAVNEFLAPRWNVPDRFSTQLNSQVLARKCWHALVCVFNRPSPNSRSPCHPIFPSPHLLNSPSPCLPISPSTMYPPPHLTVCASPLISSLPFLSVSLQSAAPLFPPTATMGQVFLESRSMPTDGKWVGIGVAALIGYILLFNLLTVVALAYLDPWDRPQPVVSEEQLESKHTARTGEVVVATGGNRKRSTRQDAGSALDRYCTSHTGIRDVEWQGESAEGKHGMVLPFEPHSLSFHNVNYFVDMPAEMRAEGAPPDARLQLLRNVSGAFRPKVLTALVGVSGAGKTTLMDVLAGRKTGGYIEGDVRVSGFPKVHETFARVAGEEFVEEVMELVELDGLRDAMVGLPGVNGLSTEQRKRLTIAVELVANPSIIFLDEPTSGLDARAAAIVMRTVRNTVDTGRTVVCTIHQPSIDIFEAFDELLLMKRGGEVIYMGPLGTDSKIMIDYFQAIPGVPPIPAGYNPATWMLDISTPAMADKLNVDFAKIFRKSEQFHRNEELIESLKTPPPGQQDLAFATQYTKSYASQFTANLWKRAYMYWRAPDYNAMRYFSSVVMALLIGGVYFGQGQQRSTQQQLLNLMGAMYTAAIFMGWNNSASIQPIVAVERTVFYRERAAGLYGAIPYALAQGAIEVPYVLVQTVIYSLITYAMIQFEWTAGKFWWYTLFMFLTLFYFTCYGLMAIAISPNDHISSVFSSFCVSSWNLLCGFLIARPHIPVWWRWAYWIDPISWTLYGLNVSQLGDVTTTLQVPGVSPDPTVQVYLEEVFGYQHSWLGYVVLVNIGFVILFFTVFAFSIKKLNFQSR